MGGQWLEDEVPPEGGSGVHGAGVLCLIPPPSVHDLERLPSFLGASLSSSGSRCRNSVAVWSYLGDSVTRAKYSAEQWARGSQEVPPIIEERRSLPP